jgi:hypothetical protein
MLPHSRSTAGTSVDTLRDSLCRENVPRDELYTLRLRACVYDCENLARDGVNQW